MRCRCNDIRNCRQDIDTLRVALQQIANIGNENLQSQQANISGSSPEAFILTSRRIQDFQSNLNENNRQIAQRIQESRDSVLQQIRMLENELMQMQREDQAFHQAN